MGENYSRKICQLLEKKKRLFINIWRINWSCYQKDLKLTQQTTNLIVVCLETENYFQNPAFAQIVVYVLKWEKYKGEY